MIMTKLNLRYAVLLAMLFGYVLTGASFNAADLHWVEKVGARKSPMGAKVYSVNNYGAIADGKSMNTDAIQKAIDECSLNGGGIVTFSPGRYLTGAIFVKTGVHLNIPKGVMILGSEDINDYPETYTRVAGIEMYWPTALINVLQESNVKISGEGTVHGQGKVYWDAYWNLRKQYEAKGLRWIVDYDSKRPRTLLVSDSKDVTIEGITFQQAGFWTIQLLYSSYCSVNSVTIQNNIDGHGPSTDGIDIDSSSYILVENCDIDCNDDNFCLKSGRDADGLRVNRPTEYIVIRNCVSRAGSGLLTCGSETSGGIRYVLADGLKAKGTTVGIRLKSAMNRGGTTEHIYINNIEMEEVKTVFEATMNWNPNYSYSKLPIEFEGQELPDHWYKMLEKVSPEDGTPYFSNVFLSNFKICNSSIFMQVAGSDISMMRNFSFHNIDAEVSKIGSVKYAENWKFTDVQIKAISENSLKYSNCNRIDFSILD